ncbi:Gfo/Idh/MocA family oxidoreductase [Rhodoblastus acidophilus]|uniref:Gfo/Idh/MocA family oxidoreductase n=1 Tax=Candidatus Rhodoblastus alkanivorans TaxID=2954117 RepID=A0ABS9ZBJ5_9HYPH|nr:Gfo/Idh/MocA family oxidoreductase [Candidatus Rhodoblastus alkanivorans]MCI4677053.1 Gfo/Idh/MocA family oxidoreductase [Candidatus Rhodoblastus alkanivorans]MCI4684406.1 Gfo/Idh/MocA family oxidoreductase [Candidatus Rhodoblastus alkanivorans]MDI4641727.1 Gfo/Idh/MocA family oxidoreductase [Rhodoblastus acidophilus]
MRDSQFGVGVVGYGYWGPNLVRNFAANPGARVVAVADLDPARLANCARFNPGVTTTNRYDDLLNDPDIEAIAVATPVHSHYDLALAALEAGKHVLVEKPMAPTADLARRLIDEADRRGLMLMVDHTFLYTPAVRKISELVRKGDLGDVYYYDSTRVSLGLFQSDVSVLWDLAVHDLSIIDHIIEEEPVAVSATGCRHVAGSPENMAHITLFFDSPCVAHVNVNWLSPVKVRQTFIGGSKKMIVYDDMQPTEKIKVYDKGITVDGSQEKAHQLRIGYRAGDMWAPHVPAKEALETEVEHFIDCVRNGAQPLCDGLSGLRVIEVLEAASRSVAEQGKPVSLRRPARLRARATA